MRRGDRGAGYLGKAHSCWTEDFRPLGKEDTAYPEEEHFLRVSTYRSLERGGIEEKCSQERSTLTGYRTLGRWGRGAAWSSD